MLELYILTLNPVLLALAGHPVHLVDDSLGLIPWSFSSKPLTNGC